jgi:hypothetical protein
MRQIALFGRFIPMGNKCSIGAVWSVFEFYNRGYKCSIGAVWSVFELYYRGNKCWIGAVWSLFELYHHGGKCRFAARQPHHQQRGGTMTPSKPMSTPYASATSGMKAREEIKKVRQRFGCTEVGFSDNFEQQAAAVFQASWPSGAGAGVGQGLGAAVVEAKSVGLSPPHAAP